MSCHGDGASHHLACACREAYVRQLEAVAIAATGVVVYGDKVAGLARALAKVEEPPAVQRKRGRK